MKYLFGFIFLMVLVVAGMAGTGGSAVGDQQNLQADSIQELRVEEVTDLLRKIDSISKADSIARMMLLRQMERLKSTEKQRRKELIGRLEDIENADSIRKATQLRRVDSLKAITRGYPVAPFSDTLFYIYTKIGPFSAKERAADATKKIKRLAESGEEVIPILSVEEKDYSTDVLYGDTVIFSVTDEDALWAGVPRQELVRSYQHAIASGIQEFYEENTLGKVLKRVAAIFAVIIVLFLIVFYINRVFWIFKKKIYSQKGKIIKGVRIRNYEFLTAHRFIHMVFVFLNILKITVVILSIYFGLLILFSIFPWTEDIADKLFGYLLTPFRNIFNEVISYLPNLVTILIIFIVTYYLVKFVRFLMVEIGRGELVIRGFHADWAKPTFNLTRLLLYTIMFVVIFPFLPGANANVLSGIMIFAGLLIALGAASFVSNLIGGIAITYMRPFKPGDRVKIGEVSGEVTERTLLITRLRTGRNEEVTVPNASVLSGHTVNFSTVAQSQGLILRTRVAVGYHVPWPKVHELLLSAAAKTAGTKKGKDPFVLQTSLDEQYVSYQLNVYTDQPDQTEVILSELHQHIQDEFSAANISLESR